MQSIPTMAAATPNTTNAGPRLNFGKHRGWLLTGVDKSYLRWMVNTEKADPHSALANHQQRWNRTWGQLADLEIYRRDHFVNDETTFILKPEVFWDLQHPQNYTKVSLAGQFPKAPLLSTNDGTNYVTEGESLPTLEQVFNTPKKVGHPTPDAANAKLFSDAAIDGASKHLLREFIQRKDQEQGLTPWLQAYAREAATYGDLLHGAATPSITITGQCQEWTWIYSYRGLNFEFYYSDDVGSYQGGALILKDVRTRAEDPMLDEETGDAKRGHP